MVYSRYKARTGTTYICMIILYYMHYDYFRDDVRAEEKDHSAYKLPNVGNFVYGKG